MNVYKQECNNQLLYIDIKFSIRLSPLPAKTNPWAYDSWRPNNHTAENWWAWERFVIGCRGKRCRFILPLFVYFPKNSKSDTPTSLHPQNGYLNLYPFMVYTVGTTCSPFSSFSIFSKPTFRPHLSCHFVFGLMGMPKPKPTP